MFQIGYRSYLWDVVLKLVIGHIKGCCAQTGYMSHLWDVVLKLAVGHIYWMLCSNW